MRASEQLGSRRVCAREALPHGEDFEFICLVCYS